MELVSSTSLSPNTLGGGKRKHKMTHRRRKHGKTAARKSHKKGTRKHRGGFFIPTPPPPPGPPLPPLPSGGYSSIHDYTAMGGKHKKTHRRKRGKSAARKSHKKRSTHRRRRHHRGGAGIMSVINKAVVPFSLYKLQKRMQDMTRKARKHLYRSKR